MEQLAQFMMTTEQVDEMLAKIETMEIAKIAYHKERGEAQKATQDKNQAFEILDKWMTSFYAMANLALDGEEQLMESLGKMVRS